MPGGVSGPKDHHVRGTGGFLKPIPTVLGGLPGCAQCQGSTCARHRRVSKAYSHCVRRGAGARGCERSQGSPCARHRRVCQQGHQHTHPDTQPGHPTWRTQGQVRASVFFIFACFLVKLLMLYILILSSLITSVAEPNHLSSNPAPDIFWGAPAPGKKFWLRLHP